MPKVSVIVANYNNARYLTECLNSLQSQTFHDYEVLVFDDASTDHSLEIIQGFTGKDHRFRLIALEQNRGVAYVRSIALSYCQGEYIAVLDADDLSLPDRLKLQADYLDAHPEMCLVGGLYSIIDETGKAIKTVKRMPQSDLELRWLMSIGNAFVHSTVMFRKNVALAVGGYDKAMTCAEDMDFYSRIMQQGKLGAIPQPLSLWRTHSVSYSQQAHDRILSGTYTVLINNARRLLNLKITATEAATLFYHGNQPSPDAQTFNRAMELLLAYRNLYWQPAGTQPDRITLLRCHTLALLSLGKRNKHQSWFPEVRSRLRAGLRQNIRQQGYAWYLDKELKISTRSWLQLWLITLGISK